MNRFLNEFKAFALSGNVVDLAIGVILGAAFKTVVDAFANNFLMGLVAAIFGKPNFDSIVWPLHGAQIEVGKVLTALVNFVMVAALLLLVVKVLMRIGLNFRAQGNRDCDYCKSFVPVDATKCMYCTSELTPMLAD